MENTERVYVADTNLKLTQFKSIVQIERNDVAENDRFYIENKELVFFGAGPDY
jgi:hypothetical protein